MTRLDAYKHFDLFADQAQESFDTLLKNDARAQELAKRYSFYAIKGGAMGALDKRLVEVFFGQRPFDQVTVLTSGADGGFPTPRTTFVTERGACLRYERTDTGSVVCTLYPASTDSLKQREDLIFYGVVPASSLNSPQVLEKHWRAFISYMECTNIDGTPSLVDRIRVGWLRFIKPLSIKETIHSPEAVAAAKKIGGYVLTIGLSGFLLALINYYIGTKDIDQLQESQRLAIQEASYARGETQAQAAHIQSLERQIARIEVKPPVTTCPCTTNDRKLQKH